MLLAPALGEPPRAVAERLGDALRDRLAGRVEKVEVAGPGFLNLFLSDAWYLAATDAVLSAGDGYGRGQRGQARPGRVRVGQPDGPAHRRVRPPRRVRRRARAHPRAGRRTRCSASTTSTTAAARCSGSARRSWPAPAARSRPRTATRATTSPRWRSRSRTRRSGSADELAAAGVEILMARIRETLERFRVHFDRWFSEATLYESHPPEPSAWDRARDKLAADGHSYRHDGALWLRTTALAGDEKDRPLVRSTGEPTYLAADVAYHWDKLERGYDTLVNVLGSDHHNYAVRLRAIIAAAGADPDRLVVPLLQFVHVVEGGERASMSKRRGDFVTLEELIDEIGVDATRFFMLSRSADSTVDLDLTLAREQSSENPVYYVQYAHARIASVLRKAGEERVAAALAAPRAGLVARAGRARAGQEAAVVPGRGRRGGRAARAAPDRRLRAGDGPGVHGVLPRLPRRRRRARGARVVPHRAERRRPAGHRTVAGAARRVGASDDVSSGGDLRGRQRPREVVALAEAAARRRRRRRAARRSRSPRRRRPSRGRCRASRSRARSRADGASPGRSRRNERSTLSTCTGRARRRESEECSVPKSSIASLTPSRWSRLEHLHACGRPRGSRTRAPR